MLALTAKPAGPVKKWKDWTFWTIDFDSFDAEGKYYIGCTTGQGPVRSYPFKVESLLLERQTLSDVIYFFKEERSSGQFDKADRHLPFDGKKQGRWTRTAAGGMPPGITGNICRTYRFRRTSIRNKFPSRCTRC